MAQAPDTGASPRRHRPNPAAPPQTRSRAAGVASGNNGRLSTSSVRPQPCDVTTMARVFALREARPPRKSAAPRASTPTDARTAGPTPAPRAPSTSPGERGGLPRRRVPGPSRAVCTLETGRYRPGRTASRHGPSEPRSSPARARGRLRRPASLPRVPRSRTGPSVWPGREPRRTDGRCPATAAPGHAPVPGGRAPLRGAASYEAEG